MMHAEALAGAVDGAQRLLRRDGAVPRLYRLAAVVAVAARRMVALAEIAEQHLTPARRGFAIGEQRVDLLALDAALLLANLGLVEQPDQRHHVGDAIGHPRVGG